MAAIDFEAEGLLEGSRARRARPAARCSTSSRRRRLARGAAHAPSTEDGWRCCRSSGCSPATASGYTRGRSPSGRGSTRTSCGASGVRSGWPCRTTTSRSTPSGTSRPRSAFATLRDAGVPDDGILEVARGDRDDDVAARGGQPGPGRRGVRRRGRHRVRGRERFAAAARAFVPLIGRRSTYVLAAPPARADPPRRVRPAERSQRRGLAGRETSRSASPTWSASRSSARRSTRRSSARSPVASASSRPTSSSRRCGW